VAIEHDDNLGVAFLIDEVDSERAPADAVAVMVCADDSH
jgi:hypothetical protein